MVPFNLRALISARGGDQAWVSYLNSLLSNITSPGPTNARLSNEPSLEIPWEYDYAGAPYLTQRIVREAQQDLYADAPVGQFGNDDLGAMSSWYVWSELGFYPETPGTTTLALGSPVFRKTIVHLAGGARHHDQRPRRAGRPRRTCRASRSTATVGQGLCRLRRPGQGRHARLRPGHHA